MEMLLAYLYRELKNVRFDERGRLSKFIRVYYSSHGRALYTQITLELITL